MLFHRPRVFCPQRPYALLNVFLSLRPRERLDLVKPHPYAQILKQQPHCFRNLCPPQENDPTTTTRPGYSGDVLDERLEATLCRSDSPFVQSIDDKNPLSTVSSRLPLEVSLIAPALQQ